MIYGNHNFKIRWRGEGVYIEFIFFLYEVSGTISSTTEFTITCKLQVQYLLNLRITDFEAGICRFILKETTVHFLMKRATLNLKHGTATQMTVSIRSCRFEERVRSLITRFLGAELKVLKTYCYLDDPKQDYWNWGMVSFLAQMSVTYIGCCIYFLQGRVIEISFYIPSFIAKI